jgi:membrane-bound lytic murein transglycosylase MltF
MPLAPRRLRVSIVLILIAAATTFLASACSPSDPDPTSNATGVNEQPPAAWSSAHFETYTARTATGTAFDELELLRESWSGDLNGMIERDFIRALVPMSKTFYFLDGGHQRGLAYDAAQLFERQLNKRLERGHLKVHMVMIPVARDELIDGLLAGYGDIALGNITITPERAARVDFSDPFMGGVNELIVTGPSTPPLNTLDDLGGREIYVRESSSYYQSLVRLNQRLLADGKELATLTLAPDVLEDEDLLEMVNAGLVGIVVVDSHKAKFWAQIFTDLVVRDDLAVARNQQIGWAFRKNSPQLAAAINEFVVDHKKGTLMGNISFNRYLRDTKWAERALDDKGRMRLENLIGLFDKYGTKYNMPGLLIAAQGYQESRLDQSVRSSAGAIGVMQLLPSTARDPNVNIPNIDQVERNIEAGTKYLSFIYDRYFADDGEMSDLDKALFSFAAYNAGPARVAQLRGQAEMSGLDPDVWFRNVEAVAAEEIGRETVQYVSNIYKYYIAYERMTMLQESRDSALE